MKLCVALLLAAAAMAVFAADAVVPVSADASQPIDRRVEDLLAKMTLAEKLGQLNMPSAHHRPFQPANLDGYRRFVEGVGEPSIGPGGGLFGLANHALTKGPRQQVEFFNELQRIALTKTRLKIPLLQTEEGTHGVMSSGATIFPEGLALGSAWSMDLIREVYAAAAREGRALGIHQLYTLVIEPNRDPRLGRNAEGYSEDPYFCARVAEAIVAGAQGSDISAPDRVVAGLCHFPGQSQPASGLERGVIDVSPRTLQEVFLPPWVAGIKKAGARGVMATYPTINGIPVHASKRWLTQVLREELGFQGLLLSEGHGIASLVYERVAANLQEAAALALEAGVDVSITYDAAYMKLLAEAIESGRVPVEWLDRAVRRVLKLKFELGLFERPYADPSLADKVVHSKAHQVLAREAARQGIVLLKNENNLLPLSKTLQSIAVIGPNADEVRNQLGDYTSKVILQPVVTVLDGIRRKMGGRAKIVYVKGCDVLGTKTNEIQKAVDAAKQSDVAIVVVGEQQEGADRTPSVGEAYDVASLDLTGMQEDLIQAVYATGTPVVVVLINGRPLSIRWVAEHVAAIVEAWQPGEQGGLAVADVLFGDYNPSGRLPITIPRHVGQLPAYYNYRPSKAYWIAEGWGKSYVDMPATPLFVFGHGLSYTTFEYSDLRISPEQMESAEEVQVSVRITNTGKRVGEEVVQLYLTDPLASVSVPVKQLRGFTRVRLKPNESRTVLLRLSPYDMSLLDADLKRVVEPGVFEVRVGRSSEDLPLKGSFRVKKLTAVRE